MRETWKVVLSNVLYPPLCQLGGKEESLGVYTNVFEYLCSGF